MPFGFSVRYFILCLRVFSVRILLCPLSGFRYGLSYIMPFGFSVRYFILRLSGFRYGILSYGYNRGHQIKKLIELGNFRGGVDSF
jgi:hypothetical protein